MKASLAVLISAAALGGAAQAATWQYHLPETGLMPSAVSASYVSHMGERHGGGTLGWQQTNLTLPLSDPRRTQVNEVYINVALDMERTELDSHTTLPLAHHVMWDLSLPVTLIYPGQNGHRWMFGAVPHVASDFDHGAHCFEPGVFVDYRFVKTDRLSVSAGLAYAPMQTRTGVLPFVTAEWTPNDDWRINLKGTELRVMYNTPRPSPDCPFFIPDVGFFVRAAGGSWATETAEGSRLLRVHSLVAGARFEVCRYDEEGKDITGMGYLELGSTLATRATFSRWNDRTDTVESHHYHPGMYASFGLDFRF